MLADPVEESYRRRMWCNDEKKEWWWIEQNDSKASSSILVSEWGDFPSCPWIRIYAMKHALGKQVWICWIFTKNFFWVNADETFSTQISADWTLTKNYLFLQKEYWILYSWQQNKYEGFLIHWWLVTNICDDSRMKHNSPRWPTNKHIEAEWYLKSVQALVSQW